MNPLLKILLRTSLERIREEIRKAESHGRGDRTAGYIAGLKKALKIMEDER